MSSASDLGSKPNSINFNTNKQQVGESLSSSGVKEGEIKITDI